VPLYACTGRHVLRVLERDGHRQEIEASGVTIVADTCVVVTPILPGLTDGVLMTNSGKYAHYGPGIIGVESIYGSTEECVLAAITGRAEVDESIWH